MNGIKNVILNGNPAPFFIGAIIFCGLFVNLRVVQPNTAIVATLFGKYVGTLSKSGVFLLPPFYKTTVVSQRKVNYLTNTLKVNDASGTPIEIAAAVVYHVDSPAAAVLDVENSEVFVQIQSDSALRHIATNYPYTHESKTNCLAANSAEISREFLELLQDQVEVAGIHIDEARFTHLAYAPEIAQAMLRKQQAEAVVIARKTLVKGAISMVEGTIRNLEARNIVTLNETDKARLVISLMTVLLAEENATPTLNVSGER